MDRRNAIDLNQPKLADSAIAYFFTEIENSIKAPTDCGPAANGTDVKNKQFLLVIF